jgi:HK97 family phage portal protein
VPAYLGASMSSGGSFTSVRSNPNLALAVSAVYGCVSLLANTVAMQTLYGYRKSSEVPTKLATQPTLLTNPFGNMTQSQWLHQFVYSMAMRGNFVGRIVDRDGYGYPRQIQPLNPDAVTYDDSREGTPWSVMTRAGRKVDLPEEDVFHVPAMTPTGEVVGLAPISWAAASLDISRSATKFAGDYLANGGIPKAVVQSDQQVTQSQAQTIKDRLIAATQRRDPIVLGDGLTYTQIQIKPNEAQFLETIAATDTQIARFFGVPPAMIGAPEGSSMTYSNREQRALDFMVFGVGFFLKRIEDSLSSVLPVQQFVKFDLSELLRTDVETQARVNVQYVAGHVKAPSEIRTLLGMPPMTEAQKTETGLVPLEVTPAGTPKSMPGVTSIPNDPDAAKEAQGA